MHRLIQNYQREDWIYNIKYAHHIGYLSVRDSQQNQVHRWFKVSSTSDASSDEIRLFHSDCGSEVYDLRYDRRLSYV